jgi:peptidyl-prolyl cis-trans isomerase C
MIKISKKPLLNLIIAGFLLAIILIILFGPFYNQKLDNQVVVSDDDIAQVYTRFQKTWQRTPTQKELRLEIQRYVHDEVLYQEALRLGYDKNDMVIRNTLIRKMTFLAESQVDEKGISDEEIQAYFNLRQEKYRLSPELSFLHVYFNADKRKDAVEQDVSNAITQLNKSQTSASAENLASYGDLFMLENVYHYKSTQEIKNLFGADFSKQILSLPMKLWSGPVDSGYGYHAVYVFEKKESLIPKWQEIKYKIVNDMVLEEKSAARDQFYTELLRQYQVVYQGAVEEILKEAQE